ncbi:RING finger protein 37 [Oopsacas minuta]|uniref:RING finger protein 37 n=1 Tax=Oopsacas minuta TaxID=111878 RepID=A0AAV7K678_9METZ|nr:RING finger protein 37 [Oopsacas minuta]
MLVNICTDLAGITASCNCVYVAEYEPQNLISSTPVLRSYGFRAERYVRGSVIVNIDLSSMKIPFSIAAIVMRGAMRENTSFVADVFVSDGDLEKSIGRLSFGGPNRSSPIGSLVRDRGVCVFDLASVVRGSYISEALVLNKISQSVNMQNTFFIRRTVKGVSVKMNNLRGGISAGLHWLEIWSECRMEPYVISPSLPSLYTGTEIRNLYSSKEGIISTPPTSKVEPTCVPEETPHEFIDQLTYELMKNPVTLPSGNTVDMESIRKLLNQDKPPIDPFTGLSLGQFTPVTNIILRDKISKFKSSKYGASEIGYPQSNTCAIQHNTEFNGTLPPEISTPVDLTEIRKKRLAHFQNDTTFTKRNKIERPHRELLLTTQLPFECTVVEQKPKHNSDTIDLTISEDSS